MSAVRQNLLEHGRATEWMTSLITLGFGVTLLLPGNSFYSPAFSVFVDIGFTEWTLGVPAILLALCRIVALYLNGSQPRRSPAARMIGAIVGSACFAMIAMTFLWPTLANGLPYSTAVTTYLFLALFDALSAYRSGADVRFGHQLSQRA